MHSSATRLAIGLACVALGCQVGACASEREGLPDQDLGNLVVSPVEEAPVVDVDKASSSAEELLNILRLPHTWVSESIGAHEVEGSFKLEVREGPELVEELEESLRMVFDGEGRFRAELDNSKEYGRHVVFDGSSLYLRPRFGRYHGRAPNNESEAGQIRSELFAIASDYLDAAAKQLEVSDKGAGTEAGRSIRKVQLQLAPKPRKVEAESLPQRSWRNDATIERIEGHAHLDVETGVPLDLKLGVTLSFQRDGRRFTMAVDGQRRISKIGHGTAVEAPADDQVLRIPARRRELDEREQLLRSIAPPAPSAPTPQDPTGGGG